MLRSCFSYRILDSYSTTRLNSRRCSFDDTKIDPEQQTPIQENAPRILEEVCDAHKKTDDATLHTRYSG